MMKKDISADEKWLELCEIEPRLAVLLEEIKLIKDDPESESFCANEVWYQKGYKERMLRLVGWEAEKEVPLLTSEEAYDVVYNKLYHALPDCRNCNCLSADDL